MTTGEPSFTPALVPAVCDCGAHHMAHTLLPVVPGQGPIHRKCDACIEKEFRGQPVPKLKPVATPDEPPLTPPRKVFGYD